MDPKFQYATNNGVLRNLPEDPSLCAAKNCTEYDYQQTLTLEFSGYYQEYGSYGYIIDLPASLKKTNETLMKLKRNKWID